MFFKKSLAHIPFFCNKNMMLLQCDLEYLCHINSKHVTSFIYVVVNIRNSTNYKLKALLYNYISISMQWLLYLAINRMKGVYYASNNKMCIICLNLETNYIDTNMCNVHLEVPSVSLNVIQLHCYWYGWVCKQCRVSWKGKQGTVFLPYWLHMPWAGFLMLRQNFSRDRSTFGCTNTVWQQRKILHLLLFT